MKNKWPILQQSSSASQCSQLAWYQTKNCPTTAAITFNFTIPQPSRDCVFVIFRRNQKNQPRLKVGSDMGPVNYGTIVFSFFEFVVPREVFWFLQLLIQKPAGRPSCRALWAPKSLAGLGRPGQAWAGLGPGAGLGRPGPRKIWNPCFWSFCFSQRFLVFAFINTETCRASIL